MSITRRLFLRNTAAASAVAATVGAPVAAEAMEQTPREPLERVRDAIAELRAAMDDYMAGQPDAWSIFLIGNRQSGKSDIVIATRNNGKTDLLGAAEGPTVKAYIDDGSPLLADDVTGTTAYADWEAKRRARS